jgi:hypothetical protein
MENLEGIIGSITVSLFLEGLKKDTTICLIQASEDIGRVAGGVFAVRSTSGLIPMTVDH